MNVLMFWSGVLKFVSENDLYIRMCPWPHAWKSTLTDLSKLCLSNCSLHMQRKDVLDRAQLKSPQVFSALAELPPPAVVTATGRAGPRLQRLDHFHANTEGKESDEAMERLRKDRKTAFNLVDLCPEYSYKNHSGFSLSRRRFLEGKCLVSYVTVCSSLNVAVCTWACMERSWKPHLHKKPTVVTLIFSLTLLPALTCATEFTL